MDTFIQVFGLVAGLVSVIGFAIVVRATDRKMLHALYVGVFVLLASIATYQSSLIKVRDDISRQAAQILSEQQMHYTSRGFVHAGLAFLEKNRQFMPDAYTRAIEMCLAYKCTEPSKNYESDSALIEFKYAMAGILRGISSVSK